MKTETRLFDLNIEKVLEHWSVAYAVREVLANALDEQSLTNTPAPQIYKDEQGAWHIRDFGRGLKYEHLTQNETKEKLKHKDLWIGKFGFGLKDAFAAFDRHKVKVAIYSKHGDITISKAGKHGFSDIATLHAFITEPSDSRLVGTDFVMDGVKDADIETAKSYFLQFSGDEILETTQYGSVIRKGTKRKAKIYVNGLCVAEEEDFLFSYNITSPTAALRKALNRERTNVGRSAYTDRVKSILFNCSSSAVANELANDLQNFERGTMHDELDWTDVSLHACKTLNATGEVIFLTSEQLRTGGSLVTHAQEEMRRVIVVPENIAIRFGKIRDVQGNPIIDLNLYRDEWNNSFQFSFVDVDRLTAKEKSVLSHKEKLLKIVGKRVNRVKEIKISETMRINRFNDDEALGVWIPDEQIVVIRRDQLAKVKSFAGTLLHELIHATTDTDDVSLEFEQELTKMLGRVFVS